jgi:hypothetical protein
MATRVQGEDKSTASRDLILLRVLFAVRLRIHTRDGGQRIEHGRVAVQRIQVVARFTERAPSSQRRARPGVPSIAVATGTR